MHGPFHPEFGHKIRLPQFERLVGSVESSGSAHRQSACMPNGVMEAGNFRAGDFGETADNVNQTTGNPDTDFDLARPVGLQIRRKRINALQMIGFKTIELLTLTNVFVTFAWYAHLRDLPEKPWIIAALVTWCIAFFESLIQLPASRTAFQVIGLAQLKILQEVITLGVFVPIAVFLMKEEIKQYYPSAAVCTAGTAQFIFRK